MKHPRTTIAGIFLIVGSLATFVGRAVGETPLNSEDWTLLFTGLNAGVIAVLAADAKK